MLTLATTKYGITNKKKHVLNWINWYSVYEQLFASTCRLNAHTDYNRKTNKCRCTYYSTITKLSVETSTVAKG